MAKFLCRTKGNVNPKGKPRVYFTCHPEDFERYFDKLCEDIFKTHDCAIYYTEDMREAIAEQDRTTDLESNNLFIIPVTFRLLTQPSRAMDEDIPYAMEKKIPVLPFMMEPGIDAFYPKKFGQWQYLNPFSADSTEISYEIKLKKYLDSVLISDEMAERIRAAFDAYIFLSYRKKDRRYANELMKLIHSHPECRDVAIWYDEFLTPGESFKENIDKMLSKSELFALLVTPNLLEEQNFVMREEYPAAKNAGKKVLPAQMEQTDYAALLAKFEAIPPCVDPHEAEFKAQLLKNVAKLNVRENDKAPMHNFLIGLAYLDGIDVETDRERGMELIVSAAESNLPEAMEKLFWIFSQEVKYAEAVKWGQRLAGYCLQQYGEEHPNTRTTLSNLAVAYYNLGEDQKALELMEKVYALNCKVLGEAHPETLSSLNNLAATYRDLGDYQKALELLEKTYTRRCRVLGEVCPDTLITLNNLAMTYCNLGDYQKALALQEKGYALQCSALGQEHPDTLITLGNLASTCGYLGDYQKALILNEKVYGLHCQILGEAHPNTLISLNNLADVHRKLGNHQKALDLQEKAYALCCEILGKGHPYALVSLNNLAMSYGELGDHAKALGMHEKAYDLQCRILGEGHPHTLTFLGNLAGDYYDLGNYQKALELQEKSYALCCRILGEEHPGALLALNNLAIMYGDAGNHRKEAELWERLYGLRTKLLGEDHPQTKNALKNLLDARKKLEEQ